MTAPAKLMTLVRAAAPEGWAAAQEAALGSGLPGARRIVLNRVRPVDVRVTDLPVEQWDAVMEGWFDTRAEAEAARDAFAQGGDQTAHLIVNELLIHDSGIRPLAAKVIVTFRRRADLDRAAAQAHWRGRHVEVGLVEHGATDFLRLYYQNHVVADNQALRPEHDYDGLPEFWLDEDALANVAAGSPVMEAIAQDEENFIDKQSVTTLLLEEHVLFER